MRGWPVIKVSAEQAKKIVEGDYKFTMVSFSLLVTRLKRVYSESPTGLTLKTCMSDLNFYLEKHGTFMPRDVKIIQGI